MLKLLPSVAKSVFCLFSNKNSARGRWRKLKGIAEVKLSNGEIRLAEVHWFEAYGIGKKFLRIKHYLD